MAGNEIEILPPSVGRPTMFTKELADRICTLIASGETIRMIVAMADMPSWDTIWRWKNERPEFSAQYARAREASAEMFEAEIIDVARCTPPDRDAAAASNVLIGALKWSASRRNRRMFLEKEQPEKPSLDGPSEGMTVRFVKAKAPQSEDGDEPS